ncbi:hypothetical protein QVD17_36104 [Tagetes erecta]|uniref:RRM domain-containing protein n=1 Tax=Tagetes erecta TaxID=13708 RepID=A0AAD8NHU0_TARER|nr:hypothetical protein QVD17_36104 [Tagetes erecta]
MKEQRGTEDPARLAELRRRKAEEQKKIFEGGKPKSNGRIIGGSHRRRQGVVEYKNKANFYISNLPNGCNADGLWRIFGHYRNLMDICVPPKKDMWGNTFGFLRFVDVLDADSLREELVNTKVDGKKITVTLSKYKRKPSNSKKMEEDWAKAKVKALAEKDTTTGQSTNLVQPSATGSGKSYREVTAPLQGLNGPTVRVAGETSASHALKSVSLVGTTHSISILDNLDFYLNTSNGPDECTLRYMGGLNVLLSFPDEEKALEYLGRTVKGWQAIFTSLTIWNGLPVEFERVAWVTISGVPPHLYDAELFDLIGSKFGKVVYRSQASKMHTNLAFDQIAILPSSKSRIECAVKIIHNNHTFSCWVKEHDTPWFPDCMGSDAKAGYPCPRCNRLPKNKEIAKPVEVDMEMPTSEFGEKSDLRWPAYDRDFEASMLERPKGIAPLVVNALYGLSTSVNELQAFMSGRVIMAMEQSFPNSMTNSCGTHEHSHNNVESGINCKEPDGSKDNGRHKLGPEFNSNGPDHLDGYDGPEINSSRPEQTDSDPFDLAPLINKIMTQDKNSMNNSSTTVHSLHPDAPKESRANKKNLLPKSKRRTRLPDLNKAFCDFTYLRLSRRLFSASRRGFNRRGNYSCSVLMNPTPDELSSTSITQSEPHNLQPLDGMVWEFSVESNQSLPSIDSRISDGDGMLAAKERTSG